MRRMNEDKLERHSPQHPLPAEIQNMKRDDTVCKYCGVSYLIHSEIKALEERLKKAEDELKRHKGAVEREALMKEECKKLSDSVNSYKQKLHDLQLIIEKVTVEVKSKDNNIQELNTSKQDLQDKLNMEIRQGEKNKVLLAKLLKLLPNVKTSLHDLISQTTQIKTDVNSIKNVLNADIKTFGEKQTQLVQVVTSDVDSLHADNSRLVTENKRLCDVEETYENNVRSLSQLRMEAEKSERDLEETRSKILRQDREIKELLSCLENEKASARLSGVQAQQYKDQIGAKNRDFESLMSHKLSVEKNMETSVLVLQDKLKYKENECKELEIDCDRLNRESTRREENQLELEAEIRRKAAASLSESDELKSGLTHALEELNSLKTERENTIRTHQNQIEQLRESFKQKRMDAENWQVKVDEALSAARTKHARELMELKENMKSDHLTELQIEKQKHQELTNKYMKNSRDAENKFKRQLSQIQSSHKSELDNIQRHMTESSARYKDNEARLNTEIVSLKGIIRDLEERLARLGIGDVAVIAELKQLLHDKETNINLMKIHISELEKKVQDLTEQVSLLQDTVRRECEERFELTEALSTAKEELLTLKRPTGGYPTPRLVYSHPEQRRHSLNSINQSASTPLSATQRPPPIKEAFTANQATIGADDVQKPTNKGEVRGSTVTDSRKRIAAAIGRR